MSQTVPFTRRGFLTKAGALIASAAILSACAAAPAAPTAAPTTAPKAAEPTKSAAPTTAPAAGATPTTAAAAKPTTAPAAATPATAPAASKGLQTIRAMHRGGKPQVDDINNIIAIYNKKFAGKYEAKMEFVEQNYNEKLLTLIASNSLADAFYMNAEVLPSFAYRGAFYDLTAIDKTDNASKEYWPELVEMSRYKGKLHGLPKDYSPYVIWVNKTRFQEAGVELPKPGWTWQDMMEKAEKLTKREGNRITQYGLFGYGWNVSIWQNGADFFDKEYTKALLDTPEAIEAIQWVADQNLKAKVAPITQDITSSGQNTYQWFGTGKMAMYFMGRWAVSQLRPLKDIEWDAYPLPKGKAEANVFLQSGPAVSAQTKAPEAAWEFCKVWTGPDGQQLNIDSGDSIPTLNSPAIREAYLGKTPPSKEGNQVFYDAIKIGHPLPTTGTFSWLEITQILNPELDLVWQGKQSASDAIKKTMPKLQELTTKK